MKIVKRVPLSFIKSILEQLSQDIEQFEAFDKTINTELLESMWATIQTVEQIPSDEVLEGQRERVEKEIDKRFDLAKSHLRKIHYFAKKVGRTDSAILYKFGWHKNEFKLPNRKQMKTTLLWMNDQIKAYEHLLVAAGAADDFLAQGLRLVEQIDSAEQARYLFNVNKDILAEKRVKELDSITQYLIDIQEIAHILFEHDLSRLIAYLYPNYYGEEDENYQFTIGARKTQPIITRGIEATTLLRFENLSAEGIYLFVSGQSLTDLPQKGLNLGRNASRVVEARTISDGTYGVLLVRNEGRKDAIFRVARLEKLI